MNKKWVPYLLIALMTIAIIVIRQYKKEPTPKPKTTTTDKKPNDPSRTRNNRERGFDRTTSYLEYSKHASCRMQCRKISGEEVEEIMQEGKINYNKSDLKAGRCPRYALEGETNDGQEVRIIFAQCNEKTVVVTVIDLEKDHACDCPGDDYGSAGSPQQNKN